MSTIAAILGRLLIAAIFVVTGAGMLFAPAASEAQLSAAGISAGLAMPVGAIEIIAGLCLAVGLMTRLAALLLFVLVAITALMFHYFSPAPDRVMQLLVDAALMGGLLMVFAYSQLWWSADMLRRDARASSAIREAEARAHAAELRAAHAEGAAEVAAPDVAPVTPRRRWWGW